MASLNKVYLIGNVGGDPEVRFTPGGQSVANFSVATNEVSKDKNGQIQKRTEWHHIVAWGKLSEVCREHLTKGKQVYIEGRIQNKQWQDRNGVKRYTTEIVAQQLILLGKPAETSETIEGQPEVDIAPEEEVPQPEKSLPHTEKDTQF